MWTQGGTCYAFDNVGCSRVTSYTVGIYADLWSGQAIVSCTYMTYFLVLDACHRSKKRMYIISLLCIVASDLDFL